MTTIEHILGWGEWSTVLLACGHRRHLRRQELKDEQLYIGKKIECQEDVTAMRAHFSPGEAVSWEDSAGRLISGIVVTVRRLRTRGGFFRVTATENGLPYHGVRNKCSYLSGKEARFYHVNECALCATGFGAREEAE